MLKWLQEVYNENQSENTGQNLHTYIFNIINMFVFMYLTAKKIDLKFTLWVCFQTKNLNNMYYKNKQNTYIHYLIPIPVVVLNNLKYINVDNFYYIFIKTFFINFFFFIYLCNVHNCVINYTKYSHKCSICCSVNLQNYAYL